MKPTKESVHPKIPVCFSPSGMKVLEDYAKRRGMLDYSQAVEYLAKNIHED